MLYLCNTPVFKLIPGISPSLYIDCISIRWIYYCRFYDPGNNHNHNLILLLWSYIKVRSITSIHRTQLHVSLELILPRGQDRSALGLNWITTKHAPSTFGHFLERYGSLYGCVEYAGMCLIHNALFAGRKHLKFIKYRRIIHILMHMKLKILKLHGM